MSNNRPTMKAVFNIPQESILRGTPVELYTASGKVIGHITRRPASIPTLAWEAQFSIEKHDGPHFFTGIGPTPEDAISDAVVRIREHAEDMMRYSEEFKDYLFVGSPKADANGFKPGDIVRFVANPDLAATILSTYGPVNQHTRNVAWFDKHNIRHEATVQLHEIESVTS